MERPVRPKQSLGQNFLINPHIIDKIISFSGLEHGETVLEIGPGRGAMTDRLAAVAGKLVAVEKDDDLSASLKERYIDSPKVSIIHADILGCSLSGLIPKGGRLIANLPYNIATVIIANLLEIPDHFTSVTVMVQKEVGERICANVGSKPYSAMSVLAASCFGAVMGFTVGPGNFFPKPKVDSAVIKLIPRHDAIDPPELDGLRRVVFCAFNSRRKMLRNSLANLPGMTPDGLMALEKTTGIDFSLRPQQIDAGGFQKLSHACKEIIVR
jgi:16S rRNA (adenine1518-N6/adenine1519-N6)-dimethyltransferase